MRLDFNVLWVDDNVTNIQSLAMGLRGRLKVDGFRLRTKFATSVDEAITYLAQDVYRDHVDLILMDYDLGKGKWGDEGLSAVRGIMPYRDIVFYSGRSTADLLAKVNEQRVEGVYVSHRDGLLDTAYGVFENLVRKVLDIEHARGIALGALSEIEYAIGRALAVTFDQCDSNQRELTLDVLRTKVEKKRTDYDAALGKIFAVAHVDELERHRRVFTIDDKVDLLQKALELVGLHAEHLPRFAYYRTSMIPRRNDLAHIQAERLPGGGFARAFYDRNRNEITSDNMRDFRIELLEFGELLEELFDLSDGQVPNE